MKPYAIGALALLSVIALPGLAAAQSSGSSEPSSSASSEASSAVSSQPSSEMSSEPATDNFGSLISALQAGKGETDLSTITEATIVNFVTVSSLIANGSPQALDNALDKNKATVDELRADVAASTALSAKLTGAGYAADDVVAVVTETDGSVSVYVDDRA